MNADEYYDSESEFDGDELPYDFLIEEPEDITLVMMPKVDVNIEDMIEGFYKKVKKCKNKKDMIKALYEFHNYSSGLAVLRNDIQYLQDRAKELEFNVQVFQNGQ